VQFCPDAAVAFAGTGIETNNPEINVAITVDTIFDRAALIFMRAPNQESLLPLYLALNERGLSVKAG
jgi:hypothetical protein